MDHDRVDDPGVPNVRVPLCRHLRCKGMFTNAERSEEGGFLPYDATIWWCARTEKQLGPDDLPCHDSECRAGRRCFDPADPS